MEGCSSLTEVPQARAQSRPGQSGSTMSLAAHSPYATDLPAPLSEDGLGPSETPQILEPRVAASAIICRSSQVISRYIRNDTSEIGLFKCHIANHR